MYENLHHLYTHTQYMYNIESEALVICNDSRKDWGIYSPSHVIFRQCVVIREDKA